MSTDDDFTTERKRTGQEGDDAAGERQSAPDHARGESGISAAYRSKLAVHQRDGYACVGCGEQFDDGSHLDSDHIVPRGKGGPNARRNLTTLCRPCHEAKHGERLHAPTMQFVSSGVMTETEFRWFEQFWKQQLPALSELALDYRIEPVFNIGNQNAWHVSLGDSRHLDRALADIEAVAYDSLGAHHYM